MQVSKFCEKHKMLAMWCFFWGKA